MSGLDAFGVLVACQAHEMEGCFYSDGVTLAWSADVECDQGNAVAACAYGKNKHAAERLASLIAASPELLDLAYQYLSDLRHPPTGDSLQRRIERADKLIAKATGAA